MSIFDFRPTLTVVTTYLHESDHAAALKLGGELYDLLTRSVNDPLSQGASIPVLSAVASNRVSRDIADVVVVIPVLGASTFFLRRQQVLRQLTSWHKAFGDGRVLLVPTSSQWRAVESDLPSKQLLNELYGDGDRRQRSLQEIVLAITRVIQSQSDAETTDSTHAVTLKNQPLFISHAKADLQYTKVAEVIRDYVSTRTTGATFFDATSLQPGVSLSKQLFKSASTGVLVSIRGDAYSSRSWCQRELLTAKQFGIPTVVVEVLRQGEKRSSPYAGNAPTIVWNGTAAAELQAAEIVLRCMVEWLRTAQFVNEAKRLSELTELPVDTAVVARPPELLDIAQGRVKPHGVVLYPDPELPVAERQLLESAFPRLKMITPTTAYRNYLGARDVGGSPLEGYQVAFSISDSPEVDGPEGFTRHHLEDAVLFLARTLISSGAAIAYGGDFRPGGYTERFSDLISAYNETAGDAANFLHLYQNARVDLSKQDPRDIKAEVHLMSDMKQAVVPVGLKFDHPDALYMSDMRRVMSKMVSARVIIGGKVTPKLYDKDESGYSGIYPGTVEEAWQTLVAQKPLYVVGGFGGAAALVAQLLSTTDKAIPALLTSKTWKNSRPLQSLTDKLIHDKLFKRLKLPTSVDELAKRVKAFRSHLMKSDAASKAWNGLTRKENVLLFTSRDPLVLATLVLKGLLEKSREQTKGKLTVEVVHGNVTNAERLNAIAVATFDNIPLAGAGAALDRAGAGRASIAHAEGQQLVRLDAPGVDADWLYLASLGTLDKSSQAMLLRRVQKAAEATREIAQRHELRRLGVVTFGGAVVADFKQSVKAMLDSLVGLGSKFTITWFETNEQKFIELRDILAENSHVALTTRRVQAQPMRVQVRDEPLVIHVRRDQQKLSVTILPPSGTAIVSSNIIPLPDAELQRLSQGSGLTRRATPVHQELLERGANLTSKLLGKQADAILDQCEGRRIVVIHDEAASRLPLETMTSLADPTPLAIRFGLSRRLAIGNATTEQLFTRMPKSGQLNLLLIANPRGDLAGTEVEARQVQALLKPLSESIKLRVLFRQQASVNAVREELARADILHYCGHAFFDAPGEDANGLLLAGNEVLTMKEMQSVVRLPRFAFVNACEGGRVRGVDPNVSASKAFAEFFLRSGVEAYLGTYWQVSDSGAAQFATSVYSALVSGATLDAAVKDAKSSLFYKPNNEWANYILYGNGAYRLLESQGSSKTK
jgi:CHAT domain-containing protein